MKNYHIGNYRFFSFFWQHYFFVKETSGRPGETPLPASKTACFNIKIMLPKIGETAIIANVIIFLPSFPGVSDV
ncbi:hypothetical protein [Massilia sp. TWP1-3-3]|uniref:hypothetical protein n=1 Tax=Massilia sp. TWP1-3-3 TaxID=2804573 RepID=UPI003CFACCB0